MSSDTAVFVSEVDTERVDPTLLLKPYLAEGPHDIIDASLFGGTMH